MKAPSEVTSQHDVMPCPACGQTISATVIAAVTLGAPTVSEGGGKVDVPVETTLTRFHVRHQCEGRVENVAADGYPAEEMGT